MIDADREHWRRDREEHKAAWIRERADALANETHICVHCKWFRLAEGPDSDRFESYKHGPGSGEAECDFPAPIAFRIEYTETWDWWGADCPCWEAVP